MQRKSVPLLYTAKKLSSPHTRWLFGSLTKFNAIPFNAVQCLITHKFTMMMMVKHCCFPHFMGAHLSRKTSLYDDVVVAVVVEPNPLKIFTLTWLAMSPCFSFIMTEWLVCASFSISPSSLLVP